MKKQSVLALLAAALLAPAFAPADEASPASTAANRLLAAYASVPALSCDIQRVSPLPDGRSLRTLSRVLYQAPDRLHSETVSPLHRRSVSDGTTFRQYIEGMNKGFSAPVAELPEFMLINLRQLPGSNANLLAPLASLPETPLPPTDSAPARYAYDAPSGTRTVLSFDADDRWIALDVYPSPSSTDLLAHSAFSDFVEIVPGVPLARRQENLVKLPTGDATETVRLSHLNPSPDLPASAFDPAAFFPGVAFTSSFDDIHP